MHAWAMMIKATLCGGVPPNMSSMPPKPTIAKKAAARAPARATRVFQLPWADETLLLRVKHAVYGSTQAAFRVEVPAALLPADARRASAAAAAFVCVDYKQAWDVYYDGQDWLARYKSAYRWDIEGTPDAQIIAENEASRAFSMKRIADMDPAQGVLGSKDDGAARTARLTVHMLSFEDDEEDAGTLTVARPLRMLLYLFWELPVADEPKYGHIGGARVASVCLECQSV